MPGVMVEAAIRINDMETEDGSPKDVFKVRVTVSMEEEFTEHPARPELGGNTCSVMDSNTRAGGTGIGNIKGNMDVAIIGDNL